MKQRYQILFQKSDTVTCCIYQLELNFTLIPREINLENCVLMVAYSHSIVAGGLELIS